MPLIDSSKFERFKYILTDLKNRRILNFVWYVANYIWNLFIPPLWVLAVWLVSLLQWIWGTGKYLVNFYMALRLIPFLFLGYGLIFLPFQESQVYVIKTLDSFFDCVDQFSNMLAIPSINDVFKCQYPLCRLEFYFWDALGYIMRFVTTVIRYYFVNNFSGDLTTFLNDTLGVPPGEIPTIVTAVIDYLDIDVCNPDHAQNAFGCTGNFYDQWQIDAIFDDLDLFWPPGPDKRGQPLHTPGFVFAAHFGLRAKQWTHRESMDEFFRDIPEEWLNGGEDTDFSSKYDTGMSTWGYAHQEDHHAIRQAFIMDRFGDSIARQQANGTCCFLPITANFTVFDLFKEGPNDFSTVVFGYLCGELDTVISQILYLAMWVFEFLGEVIASFVNNFNSYDMLTAPGEFIFHTFNIFWRVLLQIPCVQFNDTEAFFVSLTDCSCEGIVSALNDSGSPATSYIKYIPANQWEDIPGTLLCCTGFCCITDNTGDLPDTATEFFTNLADECLGGLIPTVSELNSLQNQINALDGDVSDLCGFCGGCCSKKRDVRENTTDQVSKELFQRTVAAKLEQKLNATKQRNERNHRRHPVQPRSLDEIWNSGGGVDYAIMMDDSPLTEALDEKARQIVGKRAREAGFPPWLEEAAVSAVRNHLGTYDPEELYAAMGVDPRTHPSFQQPREAQNPGWFSSKGRLGFVRFFSITYYSGIFRGVMEKGYQTVAGETGFASVIGVVTKAAGNAMFNTMDRKFASIGIPRVIRKEHLDPTRDPVLRNPRTGAKRRLMGDHWIRRYAEQNNMDDEIYAMQKNDTYLLTDGQLAARAFSVMWSDLMDLVNGIGWSSETYDFRTPSYTDVGAHLKSKRFGHTMYDFGRLFLSHVNDDVNQRYPRNTWSPPATQAEVLGRTLMYRTIAPEFLPMVEKQMNTYGDNYRVATYDITKEYVDQYERDLAKLTRMAHDRKMQDRTEGRLLSPREEITLMNQTHEEIRLMMSTISARSYMAWEMERGKRYKTSVYKRKVSYDFQRRLADYYGQELSILDRHLPLPDDPEAPITPKVASEYKVVDGHIIYKRGEYPWLVRVVQTQYKRWFDRAPNHARGVDPEILDIFGHLSPERSDTILYGSDARWSGQGVLGFGNQLMDSPDPMSVFSRGVTETYNRVNAQGHVIQKKLPIISSLGTLFSLLLAAVKQWRWASVLAVPVVASPEFQTGTRIALQPFFDFWVHIYSEGLGPTFSEAGLVQFAQEVGTAQVDAIFWVVIQVIRFLECNLKGMVIGMIQSQLTGIFSMVAAPIVLLTYPLQALVFLFSYTSPLWGNCPVQVELVDGVPARAPWNYVFDQIDADPTEACTDETDCIGGNPCFCEETVYYYLSYFYQIGKSQNCPGDSGKCLPWPRVACNFQFNTVDFSEPFEQTCDAFGYRLHSIVWYQNPSFIDFITDTAINWFRVTQFVTRNISRGYTPYFSSNVMEFALLLLAAIFFASRRYNIALFFVILLFVVYVGQMAITDTIENVIFPVLEQMESDVPLIGPVFGVILSMMRWDNYSTNEPFGSPKGGEFVCFLANSPSGAVGVFIGSLVAGSLLGLLSTGALYGTFALVVFYVLYPFRAIFGMVGVVAYAPNFPGDDEEAYNGVPPAQGAVLDVDEAGVEEEGAGPFLTPTLEDDNPYGYRILNEPIPHSTTFLQDAFPGMRHRGTPEEGPSGEQTPTEDEEEELVFVAPDFPITSSQRLSRKKRKKSRKRDATRLIHPTIVETVEQMGEGLSYMGRSLQDTVSTGLVRGIQSLGTSALDASIRGLQRGAERFSQSQMMDSRAWNLPWEED